MASSLSTLSLRSKIIGLVVASVFATAGAFANFSYLTAREAAVERANEELASTTRFASSKLKVAYETLKNDAFVVSRSPPVPGLIRSTRNGGIDAKQDSTTALWRKRLATIFRSLMAERTSYTQMRYIGLGRNGREIVRVNRTPDNELVTVAEQDLQEKAAEPYFKAGMKLSKGEFYFSGITYNRENGRIDPRRTATVRVALPVFDTEHRRFGMIVINCDYEKFVTPALDAMDTGHDIYVADPKGSYIHKDLTGEVARLEVAGHYTHPAPSFISNFAGGKLEPSHFRTGDSYGYLFPLKLASDQPNSTLGLFLLMPKEAFLAKAGKDTSRSLFIAGLIAVVALALAATLAEHITRPMALIAQKIRSFDGEHFDASVLPTELHNEVGDIARACRGMIERMDLANLHRDQMSAQLDIFIANSVDGVIVIDEQGVIQSVNPAALDIFGYEQQELTGENVSMLIPELRLSAHNRCLENYKETGQEKYSETVQDETALRKDGSQCPISLTLSQIPTGDHQIFAVTIRDMTAIEQARQEATRYARELERSNQELDQFAYVASHDLKAPLRVIDNTSSWLAEDLEAKLTEKDRKHLNVLRSRVGRMERLLDDLLEYSRVGRAQDDRQNEIVTGEQLIHDILQLLCPPQSFTIEVAPAFARLEIARMPIQKVLYNLINNAIKHHDRDSGTISLEVERLPGLCRFTVRDDGPGIEPQYQSQIFDMFSTLKPRDDVEGSGMGLAIVKKTVEYAGGDIKVESGDGRGTAFIFTWPDEEQETIRGAAA